MEDIGKIVKVTKGILYDKYAMIAAVYDTGYGVITDPSDWPSEIPIRYNAIFVPKEEVVEVSEEVQTLLKLKFPDSKQFE